MRTYGIDAENVVGLALMGSEQKALSEKEVAKRHTETAKETLVVMKSRCKNDEEFMEVVAEILGVQTAVVADYFCEKILK